MEIVFTNPNGKGNFPADLEPDMSAREALQELINHGFLAPPTPERPYQLTCARTQQALLPQQPFAAAGIRQGDVIEVVQVTPGARGVR